MSRKKKYEALPEIIQGCKQKKRKYQEMLYQKFAPSLYATCVRYASDSQMAEDILHDAFVKIFEKINQYQDLGSFEAWMKKICIYHALELLRRKQKGYVQFVQEVSNSASIPEDALSKLTENEIQQAIQKLPTGYRTVFNMYVVDGFLHREIAEQLNISESTSKTQLRKAKQYLQKELKHFER